MASVPNPYVRPKAASIPQAVSPGTPRAYPNLPGAPLVRTVEFGVSGSIEVRLDVRDAFVAASPGETEAAIKKQYTTMLDCLSGAYILVSELTSSNHTEEPNLHSYNDPCIRAEIASFDAKKQKEARKAVALAQLLPYNHTGWVKYMGDKSGPRLMATNTWIINMLAKFCDTPEAIQLKVELGEQYALNDAAPASHVANLVERHIEQAGTVQQRQALSGTGVQPDVAPGIAGGGGVPISQTVAVDGDCALTLIDRLPEGEAKTAMIMREIESRRDERKLRQEAEIVALKRREEAELAALKRREETELDVFKRREEAEAETHKRQLVVYDEQIASIHRERNQKDLMYKQTLDSYNEGKKRRKVEELHEQIEKATDEETRRALRARLEITQQIPIETTFLVNTHHIEKPQRLQQQVLVNEASGLEFRFPAGTTLMDANLESRVTVREYVDRVYPSAKLSNDDFKTLGGLVAKKVQAHNPGAANLVMKKVVEGEKYAPRMYFVRDLDGPPLDRLIENFVKEHGVSPPGGKRKRDDTSGTIDVMFKKQSVVVGTPVPQDH